MANRMTGVEDIPNWELAAAACFLEGGATKLVHTEDLAVRAFQLAPQRFCWRKYPERIDLDIARVSLTDAAKDKNGALVQGSKDSGWSLTQAGTQWVEQARQRFPNLFRARPSLIPIAEVHRPSLLTGRRTVCGSRMLIKSGNLGA